MTVDGLGDGALLAALAVAGASAGASLRGGGGVAWGRRGLWVVGGLVTLAVAILARSLLAGDFALVYVADHTTRATPWPYRLAGLWGGMAGSLLFWVWLLALVSVAAVGSVARAMPQAVAVVQAVLAGLVASFLAVSVTLAPPFTRLEVPAVDGGGLTAILQHPAMLYHPPLVYAGLVTLAVPFALAVAGLAAGRLDAVWLATCRRWALVAWVLLAAGMLAGAHWAYAELGWGGYWAWDPVENAVLMPWLAATAFLHGALVQERGDRLGRWNAGLLVGAFGLAVLGTVLTRSGAAASVHAFAEARAVGRALLVVLVAVVAGGAAMVVAHRRRVPGRGWAPPSATSREGLLLANNALLLAAVAVVLWGTVFPLLSDLVGGRRMAVSGRYFALYAALPALALVGLAGLGPVTPWSNPAARPSLRLAVRLAAAAAAGLALAGVRRPVALAAAAAVAGALALAGGELRRRRWRPARAGGLLAHVGLALVLSGVAGSTLGHHATVVLEAGSSTSVAGHRLRYDGLRPVENDRYDGVVADVTLVRRGRAVAHLQPQLRRYEGQPRPLAESALRSTPAADVLVVPRRLTADGGAVVLDVFVRPLVQLVWWGGLLVVAGGTVTWFAPQRSGGGRSLRLRSSSRPRVAGGAGVGAS